MSDTEIRQLARDAFRKHPFLARVRRIRNVVIVVSMAVGAKALVASSVRLGMAMMIVGVISTVIVLGWNSVWLNTVLFRVTKEEKLLIQTTAHPDDGALSEIPISD